MGAGRNAREMEGRAEVVQVNSNRWRALGLAWLLAVPAMLPPCLAHDLTPFMGRPATDRKHFQGNPFQRVGNPQCVSRFARPTESPHEEGYSIGGGARERSVASGERRVTEGVWGTDYAGLIIPKHTHLRWWHGERYQGGTGSYQTDGPRVVRH